jgi:hypothetical protein
MKESLSDILMRKDSLMTRGYCWALLSNRTWPVRTPARHHAISAQVSSALWQADDGFEEVLDGYTTNR